MDDFANAAADERAEAFTEAAARKGFAPAIIEKDFWICWTLGRLFNANRSGPRFIFKGGTSLSKIYGLIERFSEDIDISIDRAALGFTDDRDPANAKSNSARQKLLDELQGNAGDFVGNALMTALKTEFAEALGDQSWSLNIDDTDALTLNFAYPQSLGEDAVGLDYIRPIVRLEFGARGEHWPAEERDIRAYVAESYPDLIPNPTAKIKTLGAERTFWEKATILHMEYHRPKPKISGERISRHYYDLYMLARSDIGAKALEEPQLLAAVAQHKAKFFRAAWAKYDEAQLGSLKLAPHEKLERALRADYAKMREMFFGEPPKFEDVIAGIRELQRSINAID